MIVDAIGAEAREDGRVARTATVQFADGEVWHADVVVPARYATPESDDATAVLPLTLLLAMRLGEDLEIRGRVDAALLGRLEYLQAFYLACDSDRLSPIELTCAGSISIPGAPAARTASCLSRGVDSLYQAARRRSAHGPIDELLFIDRFEPVHDDTVRAAEIALAHQAAAVIGLPLVVVEAPLRGPPDRLFDWEDAVGAGLAWVAHALCGGLGRLVIPSSDSIATLGPAGVGPALDPLFSSQRMWVEPGDVSETRFGKVRWLAANTPALLPLIKVCYAENRADNCGQCGKCLHTMACLRAAGVLEQATAFPPLDLEVFAALRHQLISVLFEIDAVRAAAERAGDSGLAAAASESLRLSAAALQPRRPGPAPSFRARHNQAILALVRDLRTAPELGLVRAIDLRARRHVHGAGWRPAGTITAELGALLPPGAGAEVGLWVLGDGRIATAAVTPAGARGGAVRRIRHVVAALVGRDPRRTRRLARRVVDLAVAPLGPAAPDPGATPDGYLRADRGPSRIALWVGEHPATGDQYSAASAEEVLAAGYAMPRLLGYLEASAPLTGQLGSHATPLIPWV